MVSGGGRAIGHGLLVQLSHSNMAWDMELCISRKRNLGINITMNQIYIHRHAYIMPLEV